jgi:hypothetical protein
LWTRYTPTPTVTNPIAMIRSRPGPVSIIDAVKSALFCLVDDEPPWANRRVRTANAA